MVTNRKLYKWVIQINCMKFSYNIMEPKEVLPGDEFIYSNASEDHSTCAEYVKSVSRGGFFLDSGKFVKFSELEENHLGLIVRENTVAGSEETLDTIFPTRNSKNKVA